MDRLEQIYRELQPKLYTFFYIKTSSLATAEDLTQDVFYEASKNIHRYRGEATLSTWLFSIANNLLKKYYRSKKYEKALIEQLETKSSLLPFTTEQLVELKDDAEQLLLQIDALEPAAKDVVLLRIYIELSFKEIGELMGQSENYVRVLFHRTKIKLQRKEE
ncbi:RNA polymerase sigma factor [Solibacillus sp. R5-41]|uniref:RNA polymerase sigma factor n=1 Tax=Solibacillus sp. R5-41 TaxID=2048654 RepID=UPI0020A45C48|nr:RNA polymerase sigma factor [Solibacillus sp. R5-41]